MLDNYSARATSYRRSGWSLKRWEDMAVLERAIWTGAGEPLLLMVERDCTELVPFMSARDGNVGVAGYFTELRDCFTNEQI